ncbi:MAG: hypothetical protein MJ104_05600 [Lachnospiraceae bacterium]|nr:hypothetical protein [Lachnospiraceae bacterium]
MGINSINDYSSILNNYRVPTIPVVSVEDVAKQDAQRIEAEKQMPASASSLEDVSLPKARQNNAALEDIALTFNKGDDFGYIGKDSDIFSLDVENAISDMQKDDVLKQYQYFVGNIGGGSSSLVNSADGIVIPKFE